jgi:hypothetical protein
VKAFIRSFFQNFVDHAAAVEKCARTPKSQPPLPLHKKALSACKNSPVAKLPVLKDNKFGGARVRRATN